MSLPELVRFTGPVECRLDARGPLGLTLRGRDARGPVQVSFACPAPSGWPATLEAAVVVHERPDRIRVIARDAPGALDARSVFVHRDVTRAFERAVQPRRAPLAKRLFWRALLALAATSLARRMLGR